MNVRYFLQGIDFEWDSQKSVVNVRKHKVKFELACEAFFDPFVCYLDEEIVGSELRERLVGLTTTWLMLYIVYVIRGDVIRIISARHATREEREIYENQ
ncbi:MAG: BrnT family toxin [Anaerolineales bacterium]|nr:BrnT family toxin [Anaerolineales bacterium]